MELIGQLIEELQELQGYKEKYECVQKDKEIMSQTLFEYMQREYKQKNYNERSEEYRKNTCCSCRYRDGCGLKDNLPENIGEPVPSDKEWIPGRKTCENFRWS